MRLYRGRITKRFAKKYLGKRIWKKLQWAITLKEGDVVHTCDGYNKNITKIEFEYIDHIRGKSMKGRTLIVDCVLNFEDDSVCSVTHCCSPAWTKEQIIQNNEFWFTSDGEKIANDYWGGQTPLMIAIKEFPNETLNNDGTLKYGAKNEKI